MAYGTFAFGKKAGMLTPDSVNSLKNAISGLNAEQAALALSTRGLTTAQQNQVLVEAGLVASSDRISASFVKQALLTDGLDKEQQESILIKAGLMHEDSKLLLSGEAVSAQRLKQILIENGYQEEQAETLINSILQEGQNYKEALSWKVLGTKAKEAAIAMLHNPLTWIVTAIASVGLLVKGYDALIGKQEKISRQKIEGLDEDISKLDEEIKTLEELQSKLEDAKGSRYELSQIQTELNDAIGETKGLLNGESKAWDVANAKLKANIELKKQQRKQAQQDRVDESKDLYDSNSREIDWRMDLSGDKAREYAEALSWMNGKSFDEFYGSDEYNKLTNQQQSLLWEAVGFKNSYTEEWSNYWKEQIDTAYDVFEETISNYDGAGGQDFIKGLISDMVQDGASLSEISDVVTQVINNQDMQDAINKYWESLVNPDIDSEEALQAVKKIFDDIVAKNPALKDFFDNFYNGIVAGGKAATDTGSDVNKMTVSLSEMKSASDNISALSAAFKQLSDDGYLSTESISKIQEATKLSGDEWEEYEAKLLNAKVGSAEFNQIMSEMTYKILDSELATIDLTNATDQEISAIENKIAAILRENGVVNASAVAHDAVTNAKARAVVQNNIASGSIGDFINNLGAEANSLGVTNSALGELIATQIVFNSTGMSVGDKISALASLCTQLDITTSKAVSLNSALLGVSSGDSRAPLVAAQGYGIKRGVKGWEYGGQTYTNLNDALNVAMVKDITSNINTPAVTPTYASPSSGGGGGGGSGSDKNEALDNYLKYAEDIYKIHQDEVKYINDIEWAYHNLAKTMEEQVEIAEKIEETRRDFVGNYIKDLEHENELLEKVGGTEEQRITNLEGMQGIRETEATRYRGWMRDQLLGMGYTDEDEISSLIENSDYIQELQKGWWDDQEKILDIRDELANTQIDDIEHQIELNTNNYGEDFDNSSYYKQIQEIAHIEAERLRALDPEKYKEQIQEWQKIWWDAQHNIEDSLKNSFSKMTDFASSYFDSQKTLLQSHYDIINSISEAQHEINKEFEASKTMYEYLDEDTRKLLFNQEDYNVLAKELNDIQYEADRLQKRYQYDLEHATLDTIEEITANYEMQYETLMKSYEIAKADLEVAKKKQKLDNVLNERNVKMLINGQWQWVANTQDVIDAQSELADAKYEAEQARIGKQQTDSLNDLTKQQNELTTVINKFESGVIDLDTAVGKVETMFDNLPTAIMNSISEITGSPTSDNSSGGSTGSFGIYDGVGYDRNANYMSDILNASNIMAVIENNKARNAKIAGEGLEAEGIYPMTDSEAIDEWKRARRHASGTRHTSGGLTLMGEVEPEMYIDSAGHLIPINQPTLGDISSGGIVFNQEQMANLRSMWDLSNYGISSLPKVALNNASQSLDNSTNFNGDIIIEHVNDVDDFVRQLTQRIKTKSL